MPWEDGGYRCNDTSSQPCIDKRAYTDLRTAWEECRLEKHCKKITKYEAGGTEYYQLWKENDIEQDFAIKHFNVYFDSKCRMKGIIFYQKYKISKIIDNYLYLNYKCHFR